MSTPITVTCPEHGARLKQKSELASGERCPRSNYQVPFVISERLK